MAIGIALALFAAAFPIAPMSCEGGLEHYFWLGVVTVVALLILPFFTRLGGSFLARAAWATGLVGLGVASWLGGLMVANVRIICRLM